MIYFEFIGMFFSIIGILRLSKNKNRDFKLIFLTSSIYFILLGLYLFENSLNDIKFTLKPLDTFAAILAIIGSYFLAFDNYIKRNLAYNYKDINDYILIKN